MSRKSNSNYPNNSDFIFTIFDDTDVATFSYIKPIYDFLYDIGLRTTKSVWPIGYHGNCDDKGAHSLEDDEYAQYINTLVNRGFEIGYHGARMISSERKLIETSFKLFHNITGYYPRSYASHSSNKENLYWGQSRFCFKIFKKLYGILTNEKGDYYQGHVKDSDYFWGDLASAHINYVRNFTYNDIDLLSISKQIVYRTNQHKYVNHWFITNDANNVNEFNRLICPKNQERLIENKGVCIISTHFGKGFIENGKVNSDTMKLLKKLSGYRGWFVPVTDVLDYFRNMNCNNTIPTLQLFNLELKWFIHSLRRKFSALDYNKTELDYL